MGPIEIENSHTVVPVVFFPRNIDQESLSTASW